MLIKILTINTWKCDGAYHARLAILAAQLRQIDPQVIACQECFMTDDGRVDTALFLANALGKQYAFLPARPKKRFFEENWVQSFSGLAVLSAFPIIEQRGFDLPGEPGDPDRRIQQVLIGIGSGKQLQLTNVHLTHLPGATALRRAQAAFVAEKVSADPGSDQSQTPAFRLVCGDFNAKKESPEIRLFCEATHARDCYTLGQGREPHRSLLYADNENGCVDHIFTLPLQGRHAAPGDKKYPVFTDSSVVLNRPDEKTGLYASDHFGICTRLLLE